MKSVQIIFAATILLVSSITSLASEKDMRVYELRIYTSPPGKLNDLHARFRDHTTKLFEKHGMTNIAYWTPSPNPENKLIYLLAYPSREERAASWKGFLTDPDWKKAAAESEVNGKIVVKVEARFMTATDFSPEFPTPNTGPARFFELRLLTATPGNLPALQARFRDPALALYAKHGIANLHLWQLMQDQKEADATLISLHSHANAAAAKASYAAFLEDPEWIAAKKASEEKAGGSLTTVPDGIKSIFMKPTDYSPMK